MLTHKKAVMLIAGLALGGAVSRAHAIEINFPVAWASTVPLSLVACPAGDAAFTITMRDSRLMPVIGDVMLDFSSCPGLRFCAPVGTSSYTLLTPTTISLPTDNQGNATFWLAAGSVCAHGVQVWGSKLGVQTLLSDPGSMVSVASPDQDGDGVVTTSDQLILSAKGPGDPTADFNADGVHDSADDAVFVSHRGHVCLTIPTPTERRSWGGLKLIYR